MATRCDMNDRNSEGLLVHGSGTSGITLKQFPSVRFAPAVLAIFIAAMVPSVAIASIINLIESGVFAEASGNPAGPVTADALVDRYLLIAFGTPLIVGLTILGQEGGRLGGNPRPERLTAITNYLAAALRLSQTDAIAA